MLQGWTSSAPAGLTAACDCPALPVPGHAIIPPKDGKRHARKNEVATRFSAARTYLARIPLNTTDEDAATEPSAL